MWRDLFVSTLRSGALGFGPDNLDSSGVGYRLISHPLHSKSTIPSPGTRVSAFKATTAAATPTPDPAIKAARDTATYTFDLAVITFVLAIATVASVLASIVLQSKTNARDDRLRQAANDEAERVRREQYAISERLRQGEIDERRAAEQRASHAAVQQMLAILKPIEVHMNMLIAMPQYPIGGEAKTATLLFNRAFSGDIAQGIAPEIRPAIYDALIKAQQALQATLVQQRMRDNMLGALNRDSDNAAAFVEDLRVAREYARQKNRPEDHIEVERLLNSTRAYDAKHWAETKDDRNKKIEMIYPTIVLNARGAKESLASARRLLGDASGPLPELQPRGPEESS